MTGAKVTRKVTQAMPKRIRKSGHQRSSHFSVPPDALIRNSSLITIYRF